MHNEYYCIINITKKEKMFACERIRANLGFVLFLKFVFMKNDYRKLPKFI